MQIACFSTFVAVFLCNSVWLLSAQATAASSNTAIGISEVQKLKFWMGKQKNLTKVLSQYETIGKNGQSFFDYLSIVLGSASVTVLLPLDSAYQKLSSSTRKRLGSNVAVLDDLLKFNVIIPRVSGNQMTASTYGYYYQTLSNNGYLRKFSTPKVQVKLGPTTASKTQMGLIIKGDAFVSLRVTVEILDSYMVPLVY